MKLVFVLLFVFSFAYADEQNASKEQRSNMATAHEKMASCLRSEKPMSECREEMSKSCKDMGKDGCHMMGKGMEHMRHHMYDHE